jgi:hypothetical protein
VLFFTMRPTFSDARHERQDPVTHYNPTNQIHAAYILWKELADPESPHHNPEAVKTIARKYARVGHPLDQFMPAGTSLW